MPLRKRSWLPWWGADEEGRLGVNAGLGMGDPDPAGAVSTALYFADPGEDSGVSITEGRWNDPALCDLIRDLYGPHPSRPVTLPPSVRTWNDGTIPKLAEAAYQERSLPSGELDRHRLAVLADALEEVGADDLLLEHLRGPGPHARGDWVIDLLTGRN